ncbi:carbohydrate ABC transporter permease [Thermotoga sp. KOL6]|uniref:carbohydrate ABC transporter permease n=1 Tax=Thermotoga sp. KOL6 TaxID=126741 RepID=UPI000CB6FCC9|nr:carbohydrate ABC transporter permease [Thermotoga sp. KOL6]PLV59311.1 ATPase [Thermotoga sp. KOL6]
MKKLIVYLLLIFGAILMLGPFGWMVLTSFKAPSEVQQWPPRFYTKNFALSRDVKVILKPGVQRVGKSVSLREAYALKTKEENLLTIVVNDDPFHRGTMTIPLKEARYTSSVDIEEVKRISSESPVEFSWNTPEEFFESFFIYYKSGANPFFQRSSLMNKILGSIDGATKIISQMRRFINVRIKDESERERFRSFLETKEKELLSLKEKVESMKAGTTLVLTDEEIRKLYDLLKSVNLRYTGSNPLVSVYTSRVVVPIEELKKNIGYYLEVVDLFQNVQNLTVDKNIVAKSMTRDERKNLFLEKIKDFHDRQLVEKLMKESKDNLVESYVSLKEKEISEKYHVDLLTIATVKPIVSSLIGLAQENNIDTSNFERMMEELEERLSNSTTYKVLKSKITQLDLGSEFLSAMASYLKDITFLRKAYEDAMSSWKIIEAPDFVKEVRVKDGEVIEILLEGVPSVFLSDEPIDSVKLRFSFTEMLANLFQNYVDAWNAAPFPRYYFNTFFVASTTTILEVIVASLAAYAFSWMVFPGRDFIFGLYLATMMIPGEVLLVPNFITISKLGWIDTYYALIIPWIVSVFAIFLLRQHFLTIPRELFDAAKIDGCSHWRFLWQIVVPLSKPAVITSALLKFVGSWNAFLWVLIVTNSENYRTLPVGLQAFSSDVGTQYNLLMAAATFSILPVVILFIFTQKYFIQGIARTGLK